MELRNALSRIRANIGRIGRTFDEFLGHIDVPPEVAGVGGHHCIAEEIISRGSQCALEGYVHAGEVIVYGAVDSIRSGRHRSCFSRYQYPSSLPARVRRRMAAATRCLMASIDYDNTAFNIEFFWDRRADRIRLLEVNTRISKSHSPLLVMVDGVSNQQVPVELVLGRRPAMAFREGEHRLAAKFMLRVHEDAVVTHAPDESAIRALQRRFPEARVRVLAPAGTRLSRLAFQDSYSFEIGEVFLGGNDRGQLLEKAREAERILGFGTRSLPKEAA